MRPCTSWPPITLVQRLRHDPALIHQLVMNIDGLSTLNISNQVLVPTFSPHSRQLILEYLLLANLLHALKQTTGEVTSVSSVASVLSWAQSLGIGGAFFVLTLDAFGICAPAL